MKKRLVWAGTFLLLLVARTSAAAVATSATPPESLTVPSGFQVELVYTVPRSEQGSWVCLAVDPQGRLIASDQHGRLYRVNVTGANDAARATTIEPIDVELGMAQGLLWAHDSLYVVVNGVGADAAGNDSGKFVSGLYRVRDTDGDDRLDDVQLLRTFEGAGEHGPHAVVLAPDGESLYVVGGNHTNLPSLQSSRVPQVWEEDQLLPRMWDARGHAAGRMAPGGWICRTDRDGQSLELVSTGYRNQYDIAFNRQGELFTFDADMEWDLGAPWYRPTRICHATSGSDFGWRSGTGKWPAYYPDTLPPVANIGPGSPTGITFGYDARFPRKYQDALYVCDWSFGKLYAVHLEPQGATYRATIEDFITGAPLPLTDVVANPADGSLYFAIGGRNTQSALYRVAFQGDAETAAEPAGSPSELAALRRGLEAWHGHSDPQAIQAIWPHLDHPDRFVRYAARVALEWQPVETWQARALAESRPWAVIETAVALARVGNLADGELSQQILARLTGLDRTTLSHDQQLASLRAAGLVLIRADESRHEDAERAAPRPDTRLSAPELVEYWHDHYPSGNVELDTELSRLLVFLRAPDSIARTLDLLETAPTQEEQIHYANVLSSEIGRATLDDQRRYFQSFVRGASFHGGASLSGFLKNIREAAIQGLTTDRRDALAELLAVDFDAIEPIELPSRPTVKEYTLSDVLALVDGDLADCDVDAGRRLFAEIQCFKCHRVGGSGGATGPDLTTVGRRFSRRDLAEAIVEPNKVISDRFRATSFELDDGRIVTGRVANLNGEVLLVVTDMLRPGDFTEIKREEIVDMMPVNSSEMPTGLLNTLDEEEIRHLFAYLLGQ